MSYPGPPGVPSAHPSLPPRPPAAPANKQHQQYQQQQQQQQPTGPQATSRFSSTFSSSSSTYSASPGYPSATTTATGATIAAAAAPPPPPSYPSAAPGYSAPPARYGAPTTKPYSGYPAAPTAMPVRNSGGYGRGGYGGGQGAGNTPAYSTAYNNYRQQPAQAGATSYGAGPQIRNPFPAPAPVASAASAVVPAAPVSAQTEEAEMAAQIAQWQSAYLPRSETDPVVAGPIGPDAPSQYPQQQQQPEQAEAGASGEERKKTVYRTGGGKKWADDTLVEWDPTHLRLFVGNLAGETTDESLLKAFSRWKSVQKSKVIRDKRTNKSKGYGFVSFSDPDDFFQAAKEMNGKYIQSHPVTCRKANTEIKVTNVKPDKSHGGRHDKRKGNASGSGGGGGGGGGGYEPHYGPHNPGGIVKPGQKTKGGLKLLG